MAIRVVRLGTPRAPREGLRLGTVRRLPRGVRKTDYARLDYFDLWLPELAPSALLAFLSRDANFSVGCYCEREDRCHRSILRKLLVEHGAVLAFPDYHIGRTIMVKKEAS